MRTACHILLVLALVACFCLVTTGCPKKTDTETAPAVTPPPPTDQPPADETADTEEETEEEKLARGEKIMAEYDDATEPPVDWSWDSATPIDPASIPDEPVAGVIEGKLFIVKHAILQEDPDEEEGTTSWDLRFLDIEPEAGNEASMFGHDGARYLDLTVPEAKKGAKFEQAFGKESEIWDIGSLYFWYQTPRVDSPDGISVNPGGSSTALYIEFTDWEDKTDPDNEDIIGMAGGKIAIGSESPGDDLITWMAGKFEAVVAKPWMT